MIYIHTYTYIPPAPRAAGSKAAEKQRASASKEAGKQRASKVMPRRSLELDRKALLQSRGPEDPNARGVCVRVFVCVGAPVLVRVECRRTDVLLRVRAYGTKLTHLSHTCCART